MIRQFCLQVAAVFLTSSLLAGNDELPRLVLVDRLEAEGRQSGLYDDAHYVWLSVAQLARERAEWRRGLEHKMDNTLAALEMFREFGLEGDGSSLAAVIQAGAAKEHGLRNGERIPTEKFAEICNAADFDLSDDALLDRPPSRFGRHARQARGAVLGRVLHIEHGFTALLPALLLELDVEETLFVSEYSFHPYIVVATSGYAHDGAVYCSMAGMGGWLPAVGDRLIAMPVTGPWDAEGLVMPIVDPIEIFLVGEPDEVGSSEVTPLSKRSSVPKTLLDFRRRLWDARDEIDHQADDSQVPLQ